MRKYLALAKLSFQEELFYRSNFLFYFLKQSIWFLTELVFWGVAFSSGKNIAGYDYLGIFQYLLIIYLVQIMTVTDVSYNLGEGIKSGEISLNLLKPFSYFLGAFFHQYGRKIYRIIFVGLTILGFIIFGKIELTILTSLLFVIILVNATLLAYLYYYLLGTLAFWVININSILWLFTNSATFLGGGWLPISFFPGWIRQIFRGLPFYLALGFPADFFQGKINGPQLYWFIIEQFGWIVLLFFIVHFLWQKGIKEYEAVGR